MDVWITWVFVYECLDLWSRQEAWQSGPVYNVSTHHHIVCQSSVVLFHRGIQQVRYISTGEQRTFHLPVIHWTAINNRTPGLTAITQQELHEMG